MVLLQSPGDKGGWLSGIGRYSRDLAHALRACGEPVREWRVRPYELRVGGRDLGGLASLRLQLALPTRKKGDVMHSTHAYNAHRQADVVTVHDTFPETYRTELGRTALEDRLLRATMLHFLRRGTRFVMDSQATRDSFLALHPDVDPAKTDVVYLGIDEAFRPPTDGQPRHPAYSADALNVLCVADLNPRKRVDWLFEAAAGMDRPLRIVRAGSRHGHRPAWEVQRRREEPWAARLGDRLVQVGAVDEADLVRLYQGADVLVVPSLDEGFGFPPLEALRCGTPVLVTDRPVFREVLGTRAGYFRNPAELGEALARQPAGPSAEERAQRSAWVAQSYSWGRTARQMIGLYDSVRRR